MARRDGAAGRSLAWLSARLAQVPLDLAVRRTLARRPGLLGRLGWDENRSVLIVPDDLPLAFVVRGSARHIRLEAVPADRAPAADARIRGPAAALFDLVIGEDDGDAEFFSRVLSFEGDTELIVALRNAIDNAELDPLADFLPVPEPMLPAVRRGVSRLAALASSASRDLARAHDALRRVAPPAPGSGR